MNYQLYKISEKYLNLLQDIENNEGELTEELENELKISNEELESSVIDFCNIKNGLQSDIDAVNKELLRLTEFINRKQKLINTINHNLLNALILFGQEDKKGVKRFKYGTFELSTKKSKSIEIINRDEVPDEFKKVDIFISNLTLNQLKILKLVFSNNTLTSEEFKEFSNIGNLLKEDIKVSKIDLKPVIEDQQILLNNELEIAESLFRNGNITEEDYKKSIEDINLKYPLLINGAFQQTKVSLVIK